MGNHDVFTVSLSRMHHSIFKLQNIFLVVVSHPSYTSQCETHPSSEEAGTGS